MSTTTQIKRAALAERIVAADLNNHAAAYLQGVLSAKINSPITPLPLNIAEALVRAVEEAAAFGAKREATYRRAA